MAGVHGDFGDDLDLIEGCPGEVNFEIVLEEEGSFEEGASFAGVVEVDCGFDLEREKISVFLGMAAEEPELALFIESSCVAGAVPDFPVDFDLGIGISATVEVAF